MNTRFITTMKWTVILLLSFNFIVMIILSYRKASNNEVIADARGMVTRFATIVKPTNPFKNAQYIAVGTPLKVLGIYQPYPGKKQPIRWALDNEWYVQLPDNTFGHCTLPEACMGMQLLNEEGDTITIKNVRKTSLYYTFQVAESHKVYTLDELVIPEVPMIIWTPFTSYISFSRFQWSMFDIPTMLRIIINVLGILLFVAYITYIIINKRRRRHEKENIRS